jgi:hypothetical protein
MKKIMDKNGKWVEYECKIEKLRRCSATHVARLSLNGYKINFYVDASEFFKENYLFEDELVGVILKREFKEKGII